jgi:hypothetical protein
VQAICTCSKTDGVRQPWKWTIMKSLMKRNESRLPCKCRRSHNPGCWVIPCSWDSLRVVVLLWMPAQNVIVCMHMCPCALSATHLYAQISKFGDALQNNALLVRRMSITTVHKKPEVNCTLKSSMHLNDTVMCTMPVRGLRRWFTALPALSHCLPGLQLDSLPKDWLPT